jgi:hypothetical protein
MSERQLLSDHKMWKKSPRTLAKGHRLEVGAIVLDEPAWWGVGFDSEYCLDNLPPEIIEKTLNAGYAVKARSADEAVDLLCAELGIQRPAPDFIGTELYPDEKWVDDPENSYVKYKDEDAVFDGDEDDYFLWLYDQVEECVEAKKLESPQQELELINIGKTVVRMVGKSMRPYYDTPGPSN